jgi:KDO2-lipid IV(A) lauroyltransferase
MTAQNLLEVSRLPMLTARNISALVEYDDRCGLNNFEAARLRSKPILYLTGHFSAWELLPAAHAIYGFPLSFVTRPLDNPPLEQYLLRIRESSGNRVIPKKNSVRRILETLKAAGSVGILLDQNTAPREGIFVPFFGLPACTSTSIALFALRTEVTVLPGYLTPMRRGRYKIKFLPPLELIRTGDWTRDVEANTRQYNVVLEQIIREQPESWLWGHKRWSYQPPGNPGDIYCLPEASLLAYLSDKKA